MSKPLYNEFGELVSIAEGKYVNDPENCRTYMMISIDWDMKIITISADGYGGRTVEYDFDTPGDIAWAIEDWLKE